MKISLTYYYFGEYKEFKGRLLGLLDEEQFANLYLDPKNLAKKIGTGASGNLTAVANAVVKKRRLVMTSTDDTDISLVVTRPLKEVYNCMYEKEEVCNMSFIDNDDNWITIDKI